MENQTFTIEEAVEYTGIKRRTFERLNLSYSKETRTAKDGKARAVRVYSKDELDRVKESKTERQHIPAIVAPTDAKQTAQFVTASDLQNFAEHLLAGFARETQKMLPAPEETKAKKQIDISAIKDKQILNFAQAVAYSGLPADEIRAALNKKEIAGKKTSKKGTWKIYRLSLDEFCRNYFEEETK